MFDEGLSGAGKVMVAGMLRVPVEIFPSGSSGGTGGLSDVSMSGGCLNVSMSDSMDAFLVRFSLAFCEGVLDFCEVFEYFLVLVRDIVFGAPGRDFCDDLVAFEGFFTDVCY